MTDWVVTGLLASSFILVMKWLVLTTPVATKAKGLANTVGTI